MSIYVSDVYYTAGSSIGIYQAGVRTKVVYDYDKLAWAMLYMKMEAKAYPNGPLPLIEAEINYSTPNGVIPVPTADDSCVYSLFPYLKIKALHTNGDFSVFTSSFPIYTTCDVAKEFLDRFQGNITVVGYTSSLAMARSLMVNKDNPELSFGNYWLVHNILTVAPTYYYTSMTETQREGVLPDPYVITQPPALSNPPPNGVPPSTSVVQPLVVAINIPSTPSNPEVVNPTYIYGNEATASLNATTKPLEVTTVSTVPDGIVWDTVSIQAPNTTQVKCFEISFNDKFGFYGATSLYPLTTTTMPQPAITLGGALGFKLYLSGRITYYVGTTLTTKTFPAIVRGDTLGFAIKYTANNKGILNVFKNGTLISGIPQNIVFSTTSTDPALNLNGIEFGLFLPAIKGYVYSINTGASYFNNLRGELVKIDMPLSYAYAYASKYPSAVILDSSHYLPY